MSSEDRKRISAGLRKAYTPQLRAIRSEAARARVISPNFGRFFIIDGKKYRSRVEHRFATILDAAGIVYKQEVTVRLKNGRKKVVDFVAGNTFMEVSAIGYDSWEKDFRKKMQWLRGSLDCTAHIMIITTSSKYKEAARFFLGENMALFSIEDPAGIVAHIHKMGFPEPKAYF